VPEWADRRVAALVGVVAPRVRGAAGFRASGCLVLVIWWWQVVVVVRPRFQALRRRWETGVTLEAVACPVYPQVPRVVAQAVGRRQG
jgi:hypothetical protein